MCKNETETEIQKRNELIGDEKVIKVITNNKRKTGDAGVKQMF